MRSLKVAAVLAAALVVFAGPALADDWTVVKLRGGVQQLIDGTWTDVVRGDVIPDDRQIRTLADGHVDLQRATETVSLGAATQIQIHDKTDVRYTTVQQDFGTVEVNAEALNVQHFAVENSLLAAVVKGTHFVVTASDADASVAVVRGAVSVEAKSSKEIMLVTVGHMATVGAQAQIVMSDLSPTAPAMGAEGTPLEVASLDAPATTGGGWALQKNTHGALPEIADPQDGAAGLRPSIAPASIETAALGTAVVPGLLATSDDKPKPAEPINLATLFAGLCIGIAVGGVALLLKRSVN